MNPHTAEQVRQPGGRFGSKLPPPAPLTAAQELARLDALRNANGGWLVPPPDAIGIGGVRAALDWFRSVADAGGSPQDVDRAWGHWSRPLLPGSLLRTTARDQFEEIKTSAGERTAALRRRAEVEDRPRAAVATAQHALRVAEAELADVEPTYTKRQEAVNVARARLAKAQAHLTEDAGNAGRSAAA